MELVKVFNFSDKKTGFLEMIEVCLNFGIGFCITWLVLPNYKKNYFVKTNFKLTTRATLRNSIDEKKFHFEKPSNIEKVFSPVAYVATIIFMWLFPLKSHWSTQLLINPFKTNVPMKKKQPMGWFLSEWKIDFKWFNNNI